MMLSETQRKVLDRGYCILHMDKPERWVCSDLTYREWAVLCDAAYIDHQKSCLMPERNPDVCWERYCVTPAGRAALKDQTND